MLIKGDSINTLFDEEHTQQKRISVLEELTYCVDAYEGVQIRRNHRHEEVD